MHKNFQVYFFKGGNNNFLLIAIIDFFLIEYCAMYLAVLMQQSEKFHKNGVVGRQEKVKLYIPFK